MNTQLPQHFSSTELDCSYSSEYQSMYEPGYDTLFIFVDEEDEYYEDEFADDYWVDIFPTPDSSGIGRA